MSTQKLLIQNFEVKVFVTYVPRESKPEAGYHFFAYRIVIENKGNSSAQLMSRHWIITNGHGEIEEVRGAGVVGLQPKIQSGQKFEYDSACPLNTSSGSMRGFFQMVAENGEPFEIEISEFYLVAPQALH